MDGLFWLVIGLLLTLAVWHGWTIQIGNPEDDFYMKLYQLPLKRFFH